MKCSEYAIQCFKLICSNEEDTPSDIVCKKLTRNFTLGTQIENTEPDVYVVGFGTLRIKAFRNEIIDVWRSTKYYPVNKYEKHKYNCEHGLENA